MRWSSVSVRAARLSLIAAMVPGLAAGDLAYVTAQNADALCVVDLGTRQEISRLPLPGQPAGIAVAPWGEIYTVSAGSHVVRRLTPEGQVLAERTMPGGPIGVAADATRVFVSDFYTGRVWVLDAGDLSEQAVLPTGAAAAGLAVGAGFLAVAERDANSVALFDLTTLTHSATVAVGERPFGLGFAPDGRLFAGNVGSNDVTVIDPTSARVIATIPVGERPYGVAFAEGRAFVTNQYGGTVSVIDLDTLAPVATIPVGEYPEGIATAEDGALVVVANWFDNTLSLIDARTLTVTDEITTADGPRAFGPFIAETAP